MERINYTLETPEPEITTVLSYDKKEHSRRLVINNEEFGALALSFRACFLDFRTDMIKIYLDEYVQLALPLKGTHYFELQPIVKIPQLTAR